MDVIVTDLKLYGGRELLLALPRHCGDRGVVLDYRQVIDHLLRKPGAFERYRYREQEHRPTLPAHHRRADAAGDALFGGVFADVPGGNAMSDKTLNGTRVGDVFMSLIHTCELNRVDPFEYLLALQDHGQDVAKDVGRWLPWNYTEALPPADPG